MSLVTIQTAFWEPPMISDQDAEDARKQWEESFEYFIKNDSGIEHIGGDNPDCVYEPPILFDQYIEGAYKEYKESFE